MILFSVKRHTLYKMKTEVLNHFSVHVKVNVANEGDCLLKFYFPLSFHLVSCFSTFSER